MQVFIMRHGEAGLNAPTDALRPLTAKGLNQALSMAQVLKAENVTIDHVLVSPYLRAQQTLAEMGKVLKFAHVETLTTLTPGGDADMVADYIAILNGQGSETVLIVSHLPLVGYLVSELCHGVQPPMFSTAAVANIKINRKTMFGSLISMSSPVC